MQSTLETPSAEQAENLLQHSNTTVFFITFSLYFVLAQVSAYLYDPVINGGTFWPGAGITVALLLLLPSRQWSWVIIAIAISEFGGNLLNDSPFAANLLWTVGNCIEPLIGATLVRRSGNFAGVLSPQGNMLRFIAYAVFLAPLIGASIGSIGSFQIMGVPFWNSWPKWFIGDSLGVLVVAPVFLTRIKLIKPSHWTREQVIFSILLLLVGSLVLRNWSNFLDLLLPYLFLAFMLWSALRFGLQGTALTIFFIAIASTLSIAFGYVPPFQAAVFPEAHGVTMMQVRLHILSSTALVVAVLTHDLIQGLSNEQRLLVQAHRDELTGLFNRTGLNFRVASSINRRQSDKIQHLLICDLDEFKPINDQFGHLAGDQVLIEVAARLRSCIRDGDAAARIGGDEFVVLLDNNDAKSVEVIAKRVLEQIAKPVHGSFGTTNLSMSIGISQWRTGSDIETAMAAADKALYLAKSEGKNRFEWAADKA